MSRTAEKQRSTHETEVSVVIDLDGTGAAEIDTGIGFLDHLLTSFACHSLIDMTITTRGDLEVDDHHTVEDTALVLGSAISDSLGDRAGIVRFGDAAVPMDESIARATVDAGGRSYSVVELPFRGDRIGSLSTQNVEHAVASVAQTAGFTIHLTASGRNDHHMAEAAFKALARAIRDAIASDPMRPGIPSTKGAT